MKAYYGHRNTHPHVFKAESCLDALTAMSQKANEKEIRLNAMNGLEVDRVPIILLSGGSNNTQNLSIETRYVPLCELLSVDVRNGI